MERLLADYLIPHEGHDWGELLSPWHELLPGEFTLWMVNRIGDAIVVFDDGSVHMLDVGGGSISRLADSKKEFAKKIDEGSNANDWLAIALVDAMVGEGERLERGQCYGFVQPPILGGDYDPSNLRRVPLKEHYRLLGEVHRRTKDLPDGAQVRIVVPE